MTFALVMSKTVPSLTELLHDTINADNISNEILTMLFTFMNLCRKLNISICFLLMNQFVDISFH